jgi:hypothetical protein
MHYNKVSVTIFCHFIDPHLPPNNKITVTFSFQVLEQNSGLIHRSVVMVQPLTLEGM